MFLTSRYENIVFGIYIATIDNDELRQLHNMLLALRYTLRVSDSDYIKCLSNNVVFDN
jgi:hypothetical protein